jgi:peptidoglycan L-alanyl-D-glutamate endopeptidase CwlK
MSFRLSNRSLSRLDGVHTHLVEVVMEAIRRTEVDFAVLEGLRTLDRQKQLVASGASTTMNSRHLTGHAVDLGAWVDGELRWDWPLYYKIADAMFEASEHCGVDLEWGGHWKSFPDGPHHQLSWKSYPIHDSLLIK